MCSRFSIMEMLTITRSITVSPAIFGKDVASILDVMVAEVQHSSNTQGFLCWLQRTETRLFNSLLISVFIGQESYDLSSGVVRVILTLEYRRLWYSPRWATFPDTKLLLTFWQQIELWANTVCLPDSGLLCPLQRVRG